jgi:hypothetical protein
LRALSIAIFIFILSLSMSAVKEAYGLPHGGPMWSVSSNEIAGAGQLEQDESLSGYNVFKVMVNSVKALVKVIAGAALLGSTLESFSPFPLPSTLVAGLNVLGSTSALLAVVQFVRGVGTRVMD